MSTPTLANPVGCTNSPPYGPQYYPANAPLYRDPTNGYCLPYNSRGQVVRYAQYGYDPGLGVGIAFLILFAILTFVHLFTTLKSRRIWLLVIPIGAAGEVAGWVGRLLSGISNDYTDRGRNAFLLQIICLTISPVFFSGALYGLQVLVAFVHPRSSRITSRKLAWGFVAGDILSLCLQGAGGGIAAQASSARRQQTGTHIMVAGIAAQLGILIVFSLIGLDMILLGRKYRLEQRVEGLNLRRLAIGMILADATLIIRGVYRTIELAEGWSGYLITTERFFIALDAVMMLLCLIFLAYGHPAFTLPVSAGTVAASDLVAHRRRTDVEKDRASDQSAAKVASP